MIITAALLFFALCTLAAWAKACMDTRTFWGDMGFEVSPAWLRDWMWKRSTVRIIKITDGWHAMQAVWHFAFATAWLIAGVTLTLALVGVAWYWWVLAIAGAWCMRLVAQYIGFERTYPIGVEKR